MLDIPPRLREIFAFRPGQHLAVRAVIGGEEQRRTYSLCGAEGEHRILVKRVSGGLFSNYALDKLRAGGKMEVMPPQGSFCLAPRPRERRRYLMIAAGSGITPVISILESLLAAEPHSQAALLYCNRAVSSIVFRERLADFKDLRMGRFSLFHLLSREQTENGLFSGRLDEEKCGKFFNSLLPPEKFDRIFLCGPEGMMNAVKKTLRAMRYPPGRVRGELFSPATPPSAGRLRARATPEKSAAESEAEIVIDGVCRRVKVRANQTVLEAAIASGVDLPFSCRGGVCSTCRAKLLEGKIKMDVCYALEPEERRRGYVLTCQSRAKSAVLKLSFDEA